MMVLSFRPKLLDTLKIYSREDLTADLIGGLTVGIVALPLAMALASAIERIDGVLNPPGRDQGLIPASTGNSAESMSAARR